MVPFLFHNESLHLSPCGVLWWPSQNALLVADLHLEKARFFAANGQFLPPYDSYETAVRLARRIAQTGARRLICLGDSFHDAEGSKNLATNARKVLDGVASQVEWTWITGNHDEKGAFAFGSAVTEMRLSCVVLRHEAVAVCAEPEISGHYHPKIRLRHKGQSITRRCFLHGGTKLVLPAFGALTGGLDARHPAIQSAMGGDVTALVPSETQLLRFPVTRNLEQCA